MSVKLVVHYELVFALRRI